MSLNGPEQWIQRIQGLLSDLDAQLASLPDGVEGETTRQILLGLRDKLVEGMAQLEAASLMSDGADDLGDLGGADGDVEETTDKIRLAAAQLSGDVVLPPDGGEGEGDGGADVRSTGIDLGPQVAGVEAEVQADGHAEGESVNEADLPPAAAPDPNTEGPFDDGEVTRSGP
jgi:hypothetical protein